MKLERVNALFEIIDGKVVNKISRGSALKGALAGYIAEDGYRRVRADGEYYYIHYIAWWLDGREVPEDMLLDHEDGNRQNNSISNLRLATNLTNQYNKARQKDGTSKYKGVWFDAKKKVWKAAIRLPTERLYIGQFDNELEAAKAYDLFAIEIHGEFAKLNLAGPV